MIRNVTGGRLLSPALALAAAFAPLSAGAAQQIDPEVRAAVMKVVDAFNAGDAVTAAAAYSENALRMPPDREPVSGRAAIQKNAEEHVANYTSQLGFPAMGAQVDGDMAVVWVYPYTLVETPKAGGTETTFTGSWVLVLQRSGGDWEIISDIWNTEQAVSAPVAAAPAPPPPPAPAEGMPREAIIIEVRNNLVPQTTVTLSLRSPNRPLRQLGAVRSNDTQTFIVRWEDIALGFALVAERNVGQQLVSDAMRDPTVSKVMWNMGINLLTFERN